MRNNNGLYDRPAIVREAECDLATLAKRVDAEMRAFEEGQQETLERACRLGTYLQAAKERCVRQGQPWLEWLEGRGIEFQRAAEYVYVSRNWDRVCRVFPTVGNIGVQGVVKRLRADKAQGAEEVKASHGGNQFNRQESDGIEWALWSWNPVTGCLHNCPYCYARDIANRLFAEKFKPTFHPKRLVAPQKTKFPQEEIDALPANDPRRLGLKNVFVCSMADLFGRWVPAEWIEQVLDRVRISPQWNFLFLTKFPVRLAEFDFPANAWVGTTVDCQARVANAEKAFRKVKAGVKWLSLEPILEPLRFSDLGAFQWIVLGGASASTETPEWQPPFAWIDAIEKEAARLGVPFYEKPNLRRLVKSYPGDEPVKRADATPRRLVYLPVADAAERDQ
jgi:protein gp37